MSERDSYMARVMYYAGLRRGELFALRWDDIGDASIRVDTINDMGREKEVKTRLGASVAIPADLVADLRKWQRKTRGSGGSLVFRSRAGTPINPHNWFNRNLKPAVEAAGLGRVTYHMFRRGLATEMNAASANDRTIQAQLRHTDAAIPLQVYTREVPAEVTAAVDSLYRSTLRGKANEASNEANTQN